jgi:hypothetical protein
VRIELLWFNGCPNHEDVRAAIETALQSRGVDASALALIEVSEDTAADLRFPGSPTIRVNGVDIEPGFREPISYALSCRMYSTSAGLRGQPEVAWIERAIDHALVRERA